MKTHFALVLGAVVLLSITSLITILWSNAGVSSGVGTADAMLLSRASAGHENFTSSTFGAASQAAFFGNVGKLKSLLPLLFMLPLMLFCANSNTRHNRRSILNRRDRRTGDELQDILLGSQETDVAPAPAPPAPPAPAPAPAPAV